MLGRLPSVGDKLHSGRAAGPLSLPIFLTLICSAVLWSVSLSVGQTREDYSREQQSPRQQITSSGSGFFISPNGHIGTNNHVVTDCSKISIRTPDGVDSTATLIAHNETDDLAVLQSALPRNSATRCTLRRSCERVNR
jgi:S1-C subfamily serine protease